MIIGKYQHIIFVLLLLTSIPATAVEHQPGDGVKLMVKANKYYQNEQFSEALTYYTRAMEAAQVDDDSKTVIASIGNIGNIYGMMEDYDRALYYFQKGYDMATEQKNTELQLKFVTNIVMIYCQKNDVANARKYFKIQMSLPYQSSPKMRYHALCNQSVIAKTEGDLQEALYYQRQALRLSQDASLGPVYEGSAQMETGNILYQLRRYKEAEQEYLKGYAIVSKSGNRLEEASACRDLYVLYNHQNDSTKAQYYRSRYLALNDSIFDTQRMNAAKAKLFDYENRQNSAIIGSLTTRNNYLTVSVVVFLLLTIAIAVLYMKLRRRNRRLLESEKLLVEKNDDLMRQNDENRNLRREYIEAIDKAAAAPDTAPKEEESQKTTEETSTLNEEQTNRLLEKINSVLEDVSVISRDDFSLSVLAQMVGSNTKYVSMVINDTYGKNFKTYLNEFRIREACRRLSDTEHYGNMTIQAIYQELGYKAAGGFIQAFRKVVGMTPSQYQKLAAQSSAKAKKAGD